MITSTKFFVLILFFVSELRSKRDEIQDREYSWWDSKLRAEVLEKCEADEMKAYNLSRDADKLNSKSSFCPNIKSNCCGKGDHEQIKKYYMKDRKR